MGTHLLLKRRYNDLLLAERLVLDGLVLLQNVGKLLHQCRLVQSAERVARE